jgi:hypothetical protein
MDISLKQRLLELEQEAIEIQDEINAVNYRLNHFSSPEVLKASKRQLKLLNADLKRNNQETEDLLKQMKEGK